MFLPQLGVDGSECTFLSQTLFRPSTIALFTPSIIPCFYSLHLPLLYHLFPHFSLFISSFFFFAGQSELFVRLGSGAEGFETDLRFYRTESNQIIYTHQPWVLTPPVRIHLNPRSSTAITIMLFKDRSSIFDPVDPSIIIRRQLNLPARFPFLFIFFFFP